ncbi:FAD-dependent oxidoreductase [Lapidilactobacillus mulanensis]|uniref:FAD-dependent oxidoreductase n=1 Tax=Lapidilactobacillus mulanensis TaxID=2485999 RepID=A0ABW4DPQ3_9LACO|nr:FAD-dependent oxidoreductase [Lapidilactobacillus mulanensis]
MKHFDNIIIGFGKAGKTLAATLAQHGKEVLVIEKDAQMYGGTCINVACIPTKNLITSAQRGVSYGQAIQIKNQLTGKLRDKNYHKVADQETATVLNADAEFLDDQTLLVKDDSSEQQLTADRIFINTGSKAFVPAIEGLQESRHVYTSQELLAQTEQVQHLAILGGGPIGLEFASMYAQFGSEVSVLVNQPQVLRGFEPEVAQMASEDLQADGIEFLLESELVSVHDTEDGVELSYRQNHEVHTLTVDALLVATGRQANVADLHLERTSIERGKHGAIVVNEKLETTAPNIWALGDVNGGPQFTYVSLDDWRIVNNQLFGDQTRTLANRPAFPRVTFLKPAIATVGLTEAEAVAQGYQPIVKKLAAAAVPKAQVLGDARGLYKAVVDPRNNTLLGMTIYAEEAYETINLITLALNQKIPVTELRDQIYSHPTMTEALNDVFA